MSLLSTSLFPQNDGMTAVGIISTRLTDEMLTRAAYDFLAREEGYLAVGVYITPGVLKPIMMQMIKDGSSFTEVNIIKFVSRQTGHIVDYGVYLKTDADIMMMQMKLLEMPWYGTKLSSQIDPRTMDLKRVPAPRPTVKLFDDLSSQAR